MLKKIGTALAVGSSLAVANVQAAVPALDTTAAVTYLETNAGGGMNAIGVVVLSLAGLAMAISWVKATFFG